MSIKNLLRSIIAALCLALFSDYQADAIRVRLTYYLPTGNKTMSEVWPYPGSAACSWNFPMGSIIELDGGLRLVCEDRGNLGSTGWIDVFATSHEEGRWIESTYGEYVQGQGYFTGTTVIRWGR